MLLVKQYVSKRIILIVHGKLIPGFNVKIAKITYLKRVRGAGFEPANPCGIRP